MLYRILHLALRFWLRIHFKRIFITGMANIPAKGPVILACNHPNSFLDAVVIALLSKRPVNFLVRSDVFKKKWAKWLLGKLHMIPIYRLEEGMENLEKNQGSFKICNEILSRGEVLLIFSEGNCILEKRLRPLKKGTARIAFGAETLHQFGLRLKIVPVSLNYVHPAQFRTELMVNVGEAFGVKEWQETWQSEPAKAIRFFNEKLSPRLESNLLVIPKKEVETQAEKVLDLARSNLRYPLFKTYYHSKSRLNTEQNWVEALFRYKQEDWTTRIDAFHQVGQLAGIPLQASNPKLKAHWLLPVLGFLPAAMAMLLHFLPWSLAFSITRKTVRSAKFRSSVLFGTMGLLSYIWYILLLCCLLVFNWRLAPTLLGLPLLALVGVVWWESVQRFRWKIQVKHLRRKSDKAFDRWMKERDALLRMLS